MPASDKYFFSILTLIAALCSSVAIADDSSLLTKAQKHFDQGSYRAAMIELKNLLQDTPDNGEARFMLGKTYLRMNDVVSAEKELRRALQHGVPKIEVAPFLARAYLGLGEFQVVRDDFPIDDKAPTQEQAEMYALRGDAALMLKMLDDARSDYRAALKLRSADHGALLGMSRLAILEGDFTQAKTHLNDLLAVDAKNVDAHVLNGEILRMERDYQAAEQAYIKALEIHSSHTGALFGKAISGLAMQKYDVALQDAEKLSKLAPKLPAANYIKGAVYFQRKEYGVAKESLNDVLVIAPKHLQSKMLLGLTHYAENELEQAEFYLSSVVAMAPQHTVSRKVLAAVYMKLKEPNKAIETLDVVAQGRASDSQLFALLGSAYLQVGEHDKGIEYLEKASQVAPDVAAIRAQLALGRLATGDSVTAVDDLELAVEMDQGLMRADILLVYSHLRNKDFTKAIEAAKALTQKQPSNPVAYNLLAVSYTNKGEFDNAKQQFEKALSIDSKFTAAYMGLAQISLQQGKQQQAIGYYKEVLKVDDKNLAAMLALARQVEVMGKHDEAIDWIEKAQKANPESIQPLIFLSNAYLSKGDTLKALNMAKAAHDLEPQSSTVLGLLGRVQMANGDSSSAMATFRELVKLQPKSVNARFMLAQGQVNSKNYTAASETLEKALELDADYLPAHVLLGQVALADGELDRASAIAKSIQVKHPELSVAYELEGDVNANDGDFAKAEQLYAAAFSKKKSAVLSLKLHRVLMQLEKSTQAVTPLEEWLNEKPEDVSSRLVLAMAYQQMGNTDKGIEHYLKVADYQPNNVMALNNLAWLYQEKGNDKALKYAEKLYELAEKRPEVMDTVGWVFVQNGRVNRGLQLLQDAKVHAPHIPEIGYHYVLALDKAGRKSDAHKELQRFLRVNPDFEKRDDVQKLLQRFQAQ